MEVQTTHPLCYTLPPTDRLPGSEDFKRMRQGSHHNRTDTNESLGDGDGSNHSNNAGRRLGGDVRPRLGRRAPAPASETSPPAPHIQVPQSLMEAIRRVQRLVPTTRTGRDALSRLDQQLANLHVALQLEPKLTLYAPEEQNPNPRGVPMEEDEEEDDLKMADPYDKASSILPVGVGMTCATYPANAPSEDRFTVVLGTDFCFAGVWDGHGGHLAAQYVAQHIFGNFQHAVLQGEGIDQALKTAFAKTDEGYLQYARLQTKDPGALFAGTCALACYIDLRTGCITCANAGDSRAVAAVVNQDQVQVVPLSTDHTTDNANEQARCKRAHPHDTRLFVNTEPDPSEPADWRLKGIAAFTRSLGDTHLKDKASAALFNSYMPPHKRIHPRPGIRRAASDIDSGDGSPSPKTPPYLINEPEIQTATVKEGFVILACDGIWDEMSSEEAVQLCYDLIVQDDNANIADLFIEATLQKAVKRIAQSDPDEVNLTLEELKARPPGKKHWSHRSNLHDDLTVVILQFNGVEAPKMFSSSSSIPTEENEERNEQARDQMPPPPTRSVWKTESNLSTFSRDSLFSMGSGTTDESGPQYPPLDITLGTSAFANNESMMMMDTFEEGQLQELEKDDLAELISRRLGGKVVHENKLEEVFHRLDLNHTGRVRRSDFETWWGQHRNHSLSAKRHRKRDTAYNAFTTDTIREQANDGIRQSTNDQIMKMIELFGGMSSAHLRVLFDILDAEGTGILEEDEVKFLLRKVLQAEPTDILVETTFAEMDNDKSGGVEFSEFANFFGID